MFRHACQAGLQVSVSDAMWAGMTWGRASWARGNLEAAAEAYGYCADGARLLFQRQGTFEHSQEIRLSQFREAAPRAAFALAGTGRVEDAVMVFELSRAQLLFQAIERGLSLRKAPDLDAEIRSAVMPGTMPASGAFGISEICAAAGEKPLVYFVYTDRGGVALLAHTFIWPTRLRNCAVIDRAYKQEGLRLRSVLQSAFTTSLPSRTARRNDNTGA